MSKTTEKKEQAYMENYRGMVKKLRVLSRVATRQFLGSRVDGDPRVEYLTALEAFKNLANVHLEVLLELAIKKLGISQEDYLKAHGDQLAKQIKLMEEDLAVKGWDQAGNPIFDLPAYVKRIAGWPR